MRHVLREPWHWSERPWQPGVWRPHIEVNGSWKLSELLSTEELAKLYVLQNQLQQGERRQGNGKRRNLWKGSAVLRAVP